MGEARHQANPANFALALLGSSLYPPAQRLVFLRQLLDEYGPTLLQEELPAASAAFSETFQAAAGPLLDTPAALELLRRGVAVFPQSAQMANLLGLALRLAGLEDEALTQHARALELRQAARTFQAEFPKDDGAQYLWQFAEHIRTVKQREP